MRILFVDDSKVTRAVMGGLLRFHGHEVFIAGDSGEARTLLETERVDMVLTDLNMPGDDGLALTRWIRSRPGLDNLPVLLVTADFDASATESARAAGVDLFIEKTFAPEAMARAIDKAAERLKTGGRETLSNDRIACD